MPSPPKNFKKGTQKAPPKESEREIEVIFPQAAKNFLFFNAFEISTVDDFVHLHLAFQEDGTLPVSIFRGFALKSDLKRSLSAYQSYVARIGGPPMKGFPLRPSRDPIPPISFNILQLASHGELGEVMIQQFSHKDVVDVAKKGGTEVAGVSYGVYTSSQAVHKQLSFDLTQVLQAQ